MFFSQQLQYQALGLTDSFDEKETLSGSEEGSEEEPQRNGRSGGEGEGEGEREKDLFDDPKYVSASWGNETVAKAQVGLITTHVHVSLF